VSPGSSSVSELSLLSILDDVLFPLLWRYLSAISCDSATLDLVGSYVSLLRGRASGAIPTAASWMRGFVSGHSGYGGDSVLTEEIVYDLLRHIIIQ
jgi:glutamate--cysteine ligase catalytic subunit